MELVWMVTCYRVTSFFVGDVGFYPPQDKLEFSLFFARKPRKMIGLEQQIDYQTRKQKILQTMLGEECKDPFSFLV